MHSYESFMYHMNPLWMYDLMEQKSFTVKTRWRFCGICDVRLCWCLCSHLSWCVVGVYCGRWFLSKLAILLAISSAASCFCSNVDCFITHECVKIAVKRCIFNFGTKGIVGGVLETAAKQSSAYEKERGWKIRVFHCEKLFSFCTRGLAKWPAFDTVSMNWVCLLKPRSTGTTWCEKFVLWIFWQIPLW